LAPEFVRIQKRHLRVVWEFHVGPQSHHIFDLRFVREQSVNMTTFPTSKDENKVGSRKDRGLGI